MQRQSYNWQTYDYYSDPYFYTPASYRYYYGGGYRQTNRYGADLMRQAVNNGYGRGRAGRADRQDGLRYDYRNTYGYQDANYGYTGITSARTSTTTTSAKASAADTRTATTAGRSTGAATTDRTCSWATSCR